MGCKNRCNTFNFLFKYDKSEFWIQKIFNGRKLKDYLLDRLGQKIGYFEQENSANPYAKWPNFKRENQEKFISKSWDFE